MLKIVMREASEYDRTHYGLLFESVGLLRTAGAGFHNRHHPHRVQIWRDASCTGEKGTHVLSAESIMIAATPIKRDPVIGDVRIGDTVTLVLPTGEQSVWTVRGLIARDPVLVPAEA